MTRVTAGDLADYLRVDRRTVGRWAKQGRLPHTVNAVGRRLFDLDEALSVIVVDEATRPDVAYAPTPNPGHGLLWLV